MNFKFWLENREINKKEVSGYGPYRVFRVNAAAIRDKSITGDNFNHFGTHLEFPSIIPDKEIWVSRDINEREMGFLVHNGINQYEAQKKGIKDPYNYALRREKEEREKDDKIRFNPLDKPPRNLYNKLYCHIGKINVWLVNGELVRDLYKTDFIEGGNPGVYRWIPDNEIWIEKNLKEKGEIDVTVLHEYVEMVLMKVIGFSYDKAHMMATKIDFKHRGKINKKYIEELTEYKALKMAHTYFKKKS